MGQPRAVVVRASAEHDEQAVELREAVARELASRGEAVLRSVPLQTPSNVAGLAPAWEAYHALEPVRSRALVEALVQQLEGGGMAEPGVWCEALLLGALASLALADAPAVDRFLDRALVLDPALVADPLRFSPPLVARLEQRRASLPALARIEVDVRPRGASVQVDGRVMTGLTNVIPGLHFVSARAPGRHSVTRRVEVSPEGARLELTLPIAPDALGDARLEPREGLDEARAAALANDAALVVLDLQREGAVWRGSLDDGSRGMRATAMAGSIEALAVALVRALATSILVPATRAQGDDPWPWVLGVGASSAAVLVLVLVLAVVTAPGGWSASGTLP